MKLLQQFLIILAISFIGEVLNHLIPLPIPASIYGMVILFLALVTGVIKYNSVERAGKYMLEVLPVMFIPAGVGLMASWGILRPIIVPMTIIMIVSTFTVLAATGWSSQFIIRRNRKRTKVDSITASDEEPSPDVAANEAPVLEGEAVLSDEGMSE